MKAQIRLAVAAAVAIFGLAVAFLAKPAAAEICQKTECYAVTGDYEGTGSAVCCLYVCRSGETWVCHPGS
jgi:hypothetical protein